QRRAKERLEFAEQFVVETGLRRLDCRGRGWDCQRGHGRVLAGWSVEQAARTQRRAAESLAKVRYQSGSGKNGPRAHGRVARRLVRPARVEEPRAAQSV